MREDEHKLQVACVRWFSYEYPKLKQLLIAIPNGGKRHLTTAKKMKAEGAKAGVPDLFFAHPLNHYDERCPGLWIEMKTPQGRVSPNQKTYIEQLTSVGYKVKVCRSFDEFRFIIKSYLKGDPINEFSPTTEFWNEH